MAPERLGRWIVLGVLGACAWSPADAQVPVRVTISPQVSYFDLNGIREFGITVNDDAFAYQMRVGVIFPGNWGLEASGGVIPSEFNDGLTTRSTRSYFLGGAATYRYENSSPFTPLVSAGAEILDLDATIGEAEANPSLVYGAGLVIKTKKNVSVRMDARGRKSKVTGCPPGPPPGPPPRKGGCGKGPKGPRNDVVLLPAGPAGEEVAEEFEEFDSTPWLSHFEFSIGLEWRPWE
jgi:hypothetical protein